VANFGWKARSVEQIGWRRLEVSHCLSTIRGFRHCQSLLPARCVSVPRATNRARRSDSELRTPLVAPRAGSMKSRLKSGVLSNLAHEARPSAEAPTTSRRCAHSTMSLEEPRSQPSPRREGRHAEVFSQPFRASSRPSSRRLPPSVERRIPRAEKPFRAKRVGKSRVDRNLGRYGVSYRPTREARLCFPGVERETSKGLLHPGVGASWSE
jgi:hypothetical protein